MGKYPINGNSWLNSEQLIIPGESPANVWRSPTGALAAPNDVKSP